MKKKFTLIICILLLTSCGNKREGEQKTGFLANFFSLTDNEDAGVNEILNFYGGQCKYSVGASASNKDGSKKYFKLEMSQSDAIDNQLNKVHLPSSNVAYLFFKNLKDEKTNYDAIHVVLISKNNLNQEFKFPISVLEQVKNRLSLANKTVDLLKEKKFDDLIPLMNNELVPFNKDEFISRLKEIDTQFGKIKEFRLFGFKVVTYKGKEILHLSGVLMRDKQNSEFSIDIDFNSDEDKLYQLQYKL